MRTLLVPICHSFCTLNSSLPASVVTIRTSVMPLSSRSPGNGAVRSSVLSVCLFLKLNN